MRSERGRTFMAALVVLTLLGAACTRSTGPTTRGEAKAGGTFRVEADEFPWEQGYGFDPTVEYVGDNWTTLKSLLIRGLTGYPFRPADGGGQQIIPDMAESLGVSNGDKTEWTYTIKDGIEYAPPVNRKITAKDFVTAFERLGTPALTAGGYAIYYTEFIEGMKEFEEGKADEISGITMPDGPDGLTIQFKLTKPAPDWDYRMAMPASSPIPDEAARCFDAYAEYGNYIVSSGPYMIEGIDKVDFSDCDALKPPSGFKLDDHMYIVRNPNYDPATDDTSVRESLPDEFRIDKNTSLKNAFEKMGRGEIDYVWSSPPASFIREYSTDDELKDRMFANLDNATWYLTMTMTTPPFDDINVRKAVNAVMNKEGMILTIGGRVTGVPAEHAVPPSVLGALNAGEYDPYQNGQHQGDVEAAKAFMRESKYDTNGDGICDGDVCDITHVTRSSEHYPKMAEVVNESLKKIGIQPRTVEAAGFYGAAGVPARPVELASGAGWGPDWPDPLTFFLFTFHSSAISIASNINIPMVGYTREVAQRLNRDYAQLDRKTLQDLVSEETGLGQVAPVTGQLQVRPPSEPVPGIDDKYEDCSALPFGDERTQCWVDLDKYVMEEIVPWVPYRWSNDVDLVGPAVTQFEFDTFGANIAWSHVAVDPALQTGS